MGQANRRGARVEPSAAKWLGRLLFTCVLPGCLLAGCVSASIGKVRQANTSSLCIDKLLVVVEVVENKGNRLLLEPLRAHFRETEVTANVIDVDSIADLRHPSISGPIGTLKPQAVLVVDWVDAGLWGSSLDLNSSSSFKLSLYEYTAQRNLVEVWKANLASIRTMTAHVAIEPKEADAIAVEIIEELGESNLLSPCLDAE